MDLKEEDAFGGDPASHWYYISKARAIQSMLGDRRDEPILDVGAGSGVFSKMLIADGLAARATCVDPHYSDDWLLHGQEENVAFARSIETTDASIVLMMDVVEHVEDDVGLIAHYAGRTPDNATFLLTAPAFNFLWSSHDDFLDHKRRYTRESLETSVIAAGLEVVETRYFFGMLFPAVAALRLVGRALGNDKHATRSALKTAPSWLNKALVGVHDLERVAMFPFNKVGGVTVMCLARKKGQAISTGIAA